MHGYYPLPRSDGKPDKKAKTVKAKQLELPGLKGSAPVKKTLAQQCFELIEQVFKRASSGAQKYLSEIAIYTNGYAEPGYDNPPSGTIVAGNWNSIRTWDHEGQKVTANDDTVKDLGEMFEALGAEIIWRDEWTECDECGGLCRVSGDSYRWKRCYWEDENSSGVICAGCVKKNKITAKSYLESLEGDCNKAVTLDLDLTKYGYKKVNGDFENGWYDGQNDNPRAIGAALKKLGITRFVFNIDGVGQFDIGFSVYVHESQLKKFNEDKFHVEPLKEYPTPAEKVKQALQSGAGTVRQLTPQEFVEGTWCK